MKIKKTVLLLIFMISIFSIGIIKGQAWECTYRLNTNDELFNETLILTPTVYNKVQTNESKTLEQDNDNNQVSSKSETETSTSPTSNSTLSCGNLDYIPSGLPYFTNNLYKVVKWLVPIILMLMGTIDFVRAVISQDESNMKQATSRFIKRLIAAVVVFFVLAIVQFVVNLVNATGKSDAMECIDCFINDEDECKNGSAISAPEGSKPNQSGVGGSTTHQSSSGYSHGGGGGNF